MQTDFSPEEIAAIRQIRPEDRTVWQWYKLLADEDPIGNVTKARTRLRYIQAVMCMTVRPTPYNERILKNARDAYDRACAESITESA